MNHRHWQPNPPAPSSPHIPNANGGSIPEPHLQFIISWLFGATLFTVWLSISTECRCPHRGKANTRRAAALDLCLLAKWHHNRAPAEVKVNQGSGRTGRASGGGARPVSPAHVCERLQLKGDSERRARSLPTARFKCHW